VLQQQNSGSAMWGRAVLVVLAATVAACGPVADQQLHLGRGINVFSRYGYLSISMRVVPRNDTDPTWIFREPTVDIFRSAMCCAADFPHILAPFAPETSATLQQGLSKVSSLLNLL
jgi:hypothetical protein